MSRRILALSSLAASVVSVAVAALGCGAKVAVDLEPIAGSGGSVTTTTSSTTSTTTSSTTTTSTTSTTTSTTTTSTTTTSTTVTPPPPPAVYASSGQTLYLLDPNLLTFKTVGNFSSCDSWVVDIAVDKAGRLFATTTTNLYQVDPTNAACVPLGVGVGSYPNSLSFVPAGTLDPLDDALVGVDGSEYVRIDQKTGKTEHIGWVSPYSSSGDLVALPDGRTFLAAKGPACGDCLVQIDPKTGDVIKVVGNLGAVNVWGLAFWGGTTYGFTNDGKALVVDLATGSGKPIMFPNFPPGVSFWGAGSSTAAEM